MSSDAVGEYKRRVLCSSQCSNADAGSIPGRLPWLATGHNDPCRPISVQLAVQLSSRGRSEREENLDQERDHVRCVPPASGFAQVKALQPRVCKAVGFSVQPIVHPTPGQQQTKTHCRCHGEQCAGSPGQRPPENL